MMDPKAAALKKLKVKSPMHDLGHQSAIATEKKDDDDLGDAAPSLDHKKPMMSGELGPEHMAVLQDLMGSVTHPGRGAMTLDERAAGNAKEKFASMAKHKK